MCGIMGVLAKGDAAPLLMRGLQCLEYRGYDSAGIATVASGRLEVRRAVGKLGNLSDLVARDPLAGRAGIGHTRWATHGAATIANAHPQRAGGVVVVHNGIIENFRELREELGAAGHFFESETDTETVVALLHRAIAAGKAPQQAVATVLKRLRGAFALCFLFEGEEDLLICARRGSPLVIGHGEGEVFVGSDAIAMAPLTNRITYLEEGDWAVLRRSTVEIHDEHDRIVIRPVVRVEARTSATGKAGYSHFMAKEIADQPVVLAEALAHYLRDNRITLPEDLDFSTFDRLTLIACGTAHYATHVAKYWFESLAGLPCDIDVASEFRYRSPVLSNRSCAIFVSQSGETADTIAALRHSRQRVAATISVVNVLTSSIARESDLAIPILAGIEVGVASTKAFTCQLAVLLLLALKAAEDRGRLHKAKMTEYLESFTRVPELMHQTLGLEDQIKDLASQLAKSQSILFLGRGAMYPLALESALKMKEISYIHAEGYASGELKHGPIALIDDRLPVIVLAPRDALFEKTVSNMHEIMARRGKVLLISDASGVAEAGEGCWRSLTMPFVSGLFSPLLYALPGQLLAYHAAVARGCDVDQPRNLAKSVTVE